MESKRDAGWKHISAYAPVEALRGLAKKQRGYKIENLYQDEETLVDEVFRVCDPKTIQILREEFPVIENHIAWFFRSERQIDRSKVEAVFKDAATSALLEGIVPQLGDRPALYKIEKLSKAFLFRFAASDSTQTLPVSFGEKTTVPLINYYSVYLHYGAVHAVVFGPYAFWKAVNVVRTLESALMLPEAWRLMKPARGASRDFYTKIKRKLEACLVETKRHDPSGDYKTITLQARDGRPDLEGVPHFRSHYLHADSHYDVLQYRCTNALGLSETTHAKFGRPFGRFAFRAGTSVSAMLHFEANVRELLQ